MIDVAVMASIALHLKQVPEVFLVSPCGSQAAWRNPDESAYWHATCSMPSTLQFGDLSDEDVAGWRQHYPVISDGAA